MQNENKISVIVPIYKVEKYLERCVNSIINQTYENLEIILVDDGSYDKCPQICDKYKEEDKRIIVIHKTNGGLSDARNVGIEMARGQYLVFVDSDDYVENDYIEKLYNAVSEKQADMAICGINFINQNNEVFGSLKYEQSELKTGKDILLDICNQKNVVENIVAWNKIYIKTLFDTIRYPKGKIHEDEFTTYKILYNAKKVNIISECLYNYRQNPESIIGKKFSVARLDLLNALEERIEFYLYHEEYKMYEKTIFIYMNMLIEYYIKTRKYIKDSEKIQKEIVNKYCKKYSELKNKKDFSYLQKVKSIIFMNFPNMFYLLKRAKY